MILHQNTLVSLDLFEKRFVCQLKKCRGVCCVEGDIGAPLEEEEVALIEKDMEKIKPYMTRPALRLLKTQNFYIRDSEADLVTCCIDGKDCIFVYREKGINKCAIEKAWMEKKINFQKPISCHLYPVRLNKIDTLTFVNYNKWNICDPALEYGKENNVPLFVFLKDALVRKFGKLWYDELTLIAREYEESEK